eukprot:783164-Rhodomonas_salina.2
MKRTARDDSNTRLWYRWYEKCGLLSQDLYQSIPTHPLYVLKVASSEDPAFLLPHSNHRSSRPPRAAFHHTEAMSKSLSRALSFLKSKSFRAKKGKAEISEEVLAPDETALAQIGEDSPRTKDRKFDEEKNSEELSEQETQVGEDSDEAEKHVDDREVENQGGKQSKGGKASRGGSLFSRRQFFFDREKEKQAPMRFPELAKKLSLIHI